MNQREPDWKKVVNDLLETQSQAALAEKLGIAQQQISNLRLGYRGKNIGYTLGYDLLKMHKKIKS